MKIKNKGYCIFTIITVVLSVISLYGITQMINYRNYVTKGYRRAFTELMSYVNNIETELTKATVVSDKNIASNLAEKVWLYSAFAKENLGLLPVSTVELDKTSNFLSQVGDYTYSISKKFDNETFTDDEIAQTRELLNYAKNLSADLIKMEDVIMNGSLPFNMADNEVNNFTSDMSEIEEKFSEYTSLIYDGPFSNHIENKDGDLFDAEIITRYQAYKVAKQLLADKTKKVGYCGESEGNIPTYDFCGQVDEDREVYIKITKNGGYPLLMLDNKIVDGINTEISTASTNAKDYLISMGYVKMKQTGYIVEENCVVFSFAFVQNDIIMYPDLIKVKVALDGGEVVGLEAKGFLANHKEGRQLPEFKISINDITSSLNEKFKIEKINKVLIPLDTGKFVYCYEIKGNFDNQVFLLYKNTETGTEEDVKLFVKTPDGELTV